MMKKIIFAIFMLSLFLISASLWAAGYETSVLWSAKHSALAAATPSDVDGADALYFNPAGLVVGSGYQVSANLAPVYSRVEGPVMQSGASTKSDPRWSFPAAVLGSYRLSDDLGIGAGVYVSGGVNSYLPQLDYSGIDSSFAVWSPQAKSKLSVIELALGAGYRLNANWNLGAAWRATQVSGGFASAKVLSLASNGAPLALAGTSIDNISDEDFAGIKLGTQYLSDDQTWGVGLVWRSEVNFAAEGTSTGSVVYSPTGAAALNQQYGTSLASGTKYDYMGGQATLKNSFPHQIILGGHAKLTDTLTLYSAYTWTQYSRNKVLTIDGDLIDPQLGNSVSAIPSIAQDWNDQHNFRLGAQCTRYPWVLRGGYVLTTRVTDRQASRITFYAPGTAHTLIAGTGTTLLDDKMDLDFALQHSFVNGSGNTPDESKNATMVARPMSGEYKGRAYALMGSLKYRF